MPFESSLCREFPDGLFPTPFLFPTEREARLASTGRWQRAYGSHGHRAERVRPDGSRSDAHIAVNCRKMITTLDWFEVAADNLAEARFPIGPLAIGCALSYADFRSADIGVAGTARRDRRNKLAGWREGFRARVSVRATEHSDVY
jgi:hypothetical protein